MTKYYSMGQQVLRGLVYCLLSVSLLSCLGGGPVPQDHYYRLPAVNLPAHAKPLFQSIAIRPVQSSGLYHERAILFVDDVKPLELQRHHYHFWADTPANLVQQGIYQGLVSSMLADKVTRGMAAYQSEVTVDARIIRFERWIKNNQASVQLELEVELHLSGQSDKKPLVSQRYQAMQKLDSLDLHDSAQAFGDALRYIIQQLKDDLVIAKKE